MRVCRLIGPVARSMSKDELFRLAVVAIHKLAVEYNRGTVSPRAEYDHAIEHLDEMKAALDE